MDVEKVLRSHFPNKLTLLQLKIMKATLEEARSFYNVLTGHRKSLPFKSRNSWLESCCILWHVEQGTENYFS